jgi:hypothetical protein
MLGGEMPTYLLSAALILSLVAHAWLGHRYLSARHDHHSLRDTIALAAHGGPVDPAGRARASCRTGSRTAVLLILGQSNAANSINATITPSPGALNFSIYDGNCYVAEDPLLGASNGGGNFATRLASKMVDGGLYDAVVLAPIAVGSTYVEDWAADGRLNQRIVIAAKRLRAANLAVTHVLWHQGEGNRLDPAPYYREHFRTVVATLRHHGVAAPIYVAQASICSSPRGDGVRAAQRGLVDIAQGIYAGPDTDQISADMRYDGCHFDARGADVLANMWLGALAVAHVSALPSRQ